MAFTSERFHVYRVADEMKVGRILYIISVLFIALTYFQKHGWMLSCLQNPNAVQLYVVPNLLREGIIESFVEDLEKAVKSVSIQVVETAAIQFHFFRSCLNPMRSYQAKLQCTGWLRLSQTSHWLLIWLLDSWISFTVLNEDKDHCEYLMR